MTLVVSSCHGLDTYSDVSVKPFLLDTLLMTSLTVLSNLTNWAYAIIQHRALLLVNNMS